MGEGHGHTASQSIHLRGDGIPPVNAGGLPANGMTHQQFITFHMHTFMRLTCHRHVKSCDVRSCEVVRYVRGGPADRKAEGDEAGPVPGAAPAPPAPKGLIR